MQQSADYCQKRRNGHFGLSSLGVGGSHHGWGVLSFILQALWQLGPTWISNLGDLVHHCLGEEERLTVPRKCPSRKGAGHSGYMCLGSHVLLGSWKPGSSSPRGDEFKVNLGNLLVLSQDKRRPMPQWERTCQHRKTPGSIPRAAKIKEGIKLKYWKDTRFHLYQMEQVHLLMAYEVGRCFLPVCLVLGVGRKMVVQWNQGTLSSMHFRVSPPWPAFWSMLRELLCISPQPFPPGLC